MCQTARRYGWQKIDTFLVLNDLVRRVKGKPCIVTGDFNEPQFVMHDGHVVTWGQKPDGRGGFVVDEADWTDNSGRTGPGPEWDPAVRWLFEKSGLRHAYWEAHGHGAMAVSHVCRAGTAGSTTCSCRNISKSTLAITCTLSAIPASATTALWRRVLFCVLTSRVASLMQ